jgi:hypothetical protein
MIYIWLVKCDRERRDGQYGSHDDDPPEKLRPHLAKATASTSKLPVRSPKVVALAISLAMIAALGGLFQCEKYL